MQGSLFLFPWKMGIVTGMLVGVVWCWRWAGLNTWLVLWVHALFHLLFLTWEELGPAVLIFFQIKAILAASGDCKDLMVSFIYVQFVLMSVHHSCRLDCRLFCINRRLCFWLKMKVFPCYPARVLSSAGLIAGCRHEGWVSSPPCSCPFSGTDTDAYLTS